MGCFHSVRLCISTSLIQSRVFTKSWTWTFFYWVLPLLLLATWVSPTLAVTPCGGENQRACCWKEQSFGDCKAGLIQIPKHNSGQCPGLVASWFGIQSDGICVKLKPCGGENQRACCWLEQSFGDCKPGLVQVQKHNSGQCARAAPGVQSDGICIALSPCGGKGQRACCALERPLKPCNDGLKEIPGCSGDCTCGGFAKQGEKLASLDRSSSMCGIMQGIPEPETGWKASASRAAPLRGYADIHLHLFGHMGHGGGVIAGKPYDAVVGVNNALQQDFGTDLDLVRANGSQLPSPLCLNYLGGKCGKVLFHGDHLLVDTTTGFGTKDRPSSNLGVPLFNGWPTWRSTVHQQVYYRWLERAWRGGLRLVTMLAVTNEALCRSERRLRDAVCTDSMASINAQLEEARKFQQFIDSKSGGSGLGWFRIVLTPQEARQVIRDGKLAVVLGIEVDNLFNCKLHSGCDRATIRRSVDEVFSKGVRHVFPIHNFDNAFGGAAAWQSVIDVGNRAVEGEWWQTESCPSGYGFKIDLGGSFLTFIANLLGFGGLGGAPLQAGATTCNQRGLTPRGVELINALMDKGIMIDVDHMSIKSVDQTLTLAEKRVPRYPVVASHVQFFDLNQQKIRHERMRTKAQLQRIKAVGGMVGAMLKDDVQDTDRIGEKWNAPYRPPSGGAIADDCRHSSKTWAQMLQYSVDVMGGPVAFGSDFNGVAGHVGPRFGSDACGSDIAERIAQSQANNPLRYPFELPGFGVLDRQVTGQKTFDFNVDGLAHVGLLPDLVADLKAIGLPQRYIDSLFQSAEAYVAAWERAVQASAKK